jgi:hypothetical protein
MNCVGHPLTAQAIRAIFNRFGNSAVGFGTKGGPGSNRKRCGSNQKMKIQKRGAIILTLLWSLAIGGAVLDQVQFHSLHFIWMYAVGPFVIVWAWASIRKNSN